MVSRQDRQLQALLLVSGWKDWGEILRQDELLDTFFQMQIISHPRSHGRHVSNFPRRLKGPSVISVP